MFAESSKCEVLRHRTMIGRLAPHYAALEQDGTGLMIASAKPFMFVQIDGKPVEEQKMDTSEKKGQILCQWN